MNMNYNEIEIIKGTDSFVEELRQYKTCSADSLWRVGSDGKLTVDSTIMFNKVVIYGDDLLEFRGRNVTFWFNEKVNFVSKVDTGNSYRYYIFFESEVRYSNDKKETPEPSFVISAEKSKIVKKD